MKKSFAKSIAWAVCLMTVLFVVDFSRALGADRAPNIILILCDNLGYGDVGCYGSVKHRTPHVDRLAAEGVRFTHFYVSSGVCTPSRASLMTGCYPRRVNMHEDPRGGLVLRPVDNKGLHPDEVTMAEMLKGAGYATTIIGKWHLGDQAPFLPTRQGFDSYLGIPYSDNAVGDKKPGWPPLPLMEGEVVIEAPVDRDTLTKRYTERAIAFMRENRERPFFLYLPHAMPGSTDAPYASPKFKGKSANGPFGDSVEEIDWSTGQIMAAVKELGLDDDTLVIWMSDNGAPRRNPVQGSNLPMGGWGYTTSEGGQRVPCVMRWPGKIPAGVTQSEMATSMDLFATFAKLVGEDLSKGRKIDGKDIGPLMFGEAGAKTPHEAFYYYYMRQLQAVRSGKWKLYLASAKSVANGSGRTQRVETRLYDVVNEPSETVNRAGEFPEVVKRLEGLAEMARADLGDVGREGAGQREAGWVEVGKPQVLEGR